MVQGISNNSVTVRLNCGCLPRRCLVADTETAVRTHRNVSINTTETQWPALDIRGRLPTVALETASPTVLSPPKARRNKKVLGNKKNETHEVVLKFERCILTDVSVRHIKHGPLVWDADSTLLDSLCQPLRSFPLLCLFLLSPLQYASFHLCLLF